MKMEQVVHDRVEEHKDIVFCLLVVAFVFHVEMKQERLGFVVAAIFSAQTFLLVYCKLLQNFLVRLSSLIEEMMPSISFYVRK